MVFILSDDGRDEKFPAVRTAFERYRDYLRQNQAAFPSRAYELATSDWFYDPGDHRCPHDAWLETFQMAETPERKPQPRSCSISLRLLGAYHDGYIEIAYPTVFSYSFLGSMAGKPVSHGDWRYDEFRLSERGHLIHEIEWAGAPGAQRKSFSWIIEADDIVFRWIPANEEKG
jgi:hypothetical protein